MFGEDTNVMVGRGFRSIHILDRDEHATFAPLQAEAFSREGQDRHTIEF